MRARAKIIVTMSLYRTPALLALSLTTALGIAQTTEPHTTLINRDAAAYNAKSQKLYLVDTEHDAVTVINRKGDISSIPVGKRPDAVAVNNSTGMVYVVSPISRNVSVIDSAEDKVVATVATPARSYAIAVDEDSNRVYVSNTFSSMLTVIDGEKNTADNLKVGSNDAILVDYERKRVYLLGYESDTITELNPADGSTRKIPTGAMHQWGILLSGGRLYVTHVQDANIASIDLASQSIRTIATGRMPCAIVADPETHELYVANYASGTVTVIRDDKPIATIRTVEHPQALAIDPSTHRLYVASPQNNAVAIVDLRTRRMTSRMDVAAHPLAVAVHPETHTAWSVNVAEPSFTQIAK